MSNRTPPEQIARPEPAVPAIEFPCEYPIRVMGLAADDFAELIVTVIEYHAPEVRQFPAQSRLSRTGRWVSVTVTIMATGAPQLQAIFEDLKATGRVQMVL